MVSLDQIYLLEQKVESAVAKILQLTAEKDALVQRCTQLEEENKKLHTDILDFNQDQERIEQGIMKALDKLNAVENSVLQAVSTQHSSGEEQVTVQVVQDSLSSPIHEVQSQAPNHNNEMKEQSDSVDSTIDQVEEQIPINDMNLTTVFTEEIVKKDDILSQIVTNPVIMQDNNGVNSQSNTENLFVQSQDVQNQEHLDIF